MADVSWMPGVVAMAGGLAIGAALAWMQRDEGAAGEERQARLDDLRQRKELLFEQLHGLEDVDGARGVQAASGERRALELQAAAVLKELDQLQAGDARDAGPAASGAMSAQMRGMLQGGLAVGFVAIIVFALNRGTTERVGDMGPTGRAPIVSTLERPDAVPQAGEPGGAVPGVPENLQPKASPMLDAARAKVAATPEDPGAWAALGYALIDAEGWIDAFESSRKLLELSPEDPDGLTQQAAVRVAMGQDSLAVDLLDRALAQEGKHLPALSYRGMVAWRGQDAEAARGFWERALAVAGPGQGFEGLIAMTNGERPPPLDRPADGTVPDGHPGGAPAGHPPSGDLPAGNPPSGGMPAGHPPAAGGDVELSGTLTLAEGATVPAGAVLFVNIRPEGQTRGPPARALKLTASFPQPFSIRSTDSMIQGMPFPGSATVTARVDFDGNAMTKAEGEPIATAVVTAGQTGLSLVLQ
jgi:tetratricopeptide (TPR) repeat protein